MTCKEQMLRWLKGLGPAGRSKLYGPSCTRTSDPSSTFYEYATSSRSFCQERFLGTLFYSEICPFSHKNRKIAVFLSHRVIHPMHTSLQGARPKRTTRSGAEGKATSHRNSLSGLPPYRTTNRNFSSDLLEIRHSSLIGHTISYSI